MADRSIVVRLRAEVADFKSAMQSAAKSTQDASSKMQTAIQKNSAHINTLANGAGLLGAAMVGASVLAIKAFADFDAEMSNVQAATHETAGTMAELRAAAIQAGKDTIYNAKESAGAITELAKAGVSASDILGGGLKGALGLASAGSIDVADAAEIAASTLNQFNLKGKDVVHVADLLAAGANKAQGGVLDLGNGLKFVGPVAAGMNISLEETVGVLAQFASKGVIGEQAGTSLRGVLASLTSPSAAASTELKALNVNLYDAQGKFLGLSNMAGQLEQAYGGMSDAQKNASLGVIFGNQQVTAARLLLDGGSAAVDKWTAAVNDQGYAAETAAIKLNNLKGDWEQLTGSIETASISLGEQANGPLRGVVQTATDIVNALADAPAAVQAVTLAIIGGGGLLLLGGAGLGKVVVMISDAKVAMEGLGLSGKAAGLAVGGIGAALAIVTLSVMTWAKAQAEARAKVDALADSLDPLTGALTENSTAFVKNELTRERGFGIGNTKSMIDAGTQMGVSVDTLTQAYLGNADALAEAKAAADAYREGDDLLLSKNSQANAFTDSLDDQVKRLGEAKDITEAKRKVDQAAATAQTEVAKATGVATGAIVDQVDALQELIDAQDKAAGVVLSERDAQRNLQAAIDDAAASIQSQVDDLAAQYEAQGMGTNAARKRAEAEVAVADKLDITTEAGRKNQSALDDVAKSGWDLIASMKANGSTTDELRGQMTTVRDEFIATATSMGMSEDAAKALADQLGLIPTNIVPVVALDLNNAYQQLAAFRAEVTKSLQIKVDANPSYSPASSPNSIRRAAGGYLSGPGTGTSDSIPVLASNGEYIVKADSVAHYGRAYFDGLNAQRFAGGGYVGGSAGSTSSGASNTGVQFGDVTLVAADPRAALNGLRDTFRFEMAGRVL